MGTTYHVKFRPDEDAAAVQREIDKLLATIDRQMSTYRDDSELMAFNRAAANEWIPFSKGTVVVLREARRVHALSGGCSDVTVGPLVRLWKGATTEPPSEAEVASTLRVVGLPHVEVRDDPPALRKDVGGVEVDFSSIAPGYAVDEIGRLLEARGARDYLIELGGEVRARGVREDGTPWRLGIESPWPVERPISRTIPLADVAVSTSGDYRNARIIGGKAYGHILDPRTGAALPMRGFAVTIVAKTCLEADALSTPLVVMGPDAGYDWCVEHGVAAFFQTRGDHRPKVVERATPRFVELTGK